MIRGARRDDIAALADLESRAWRWAFADIVPEPHMPTAQERRALWEQRRLEGRYVWDQDGRIAGVVGVVDQAEPDEAPDTGRLQALYVDPPAQGAGIGGALHDHALEVLRTAGCAAATLWVFRENGHARRFYEARGWRPDGTVGSWHGIPQLRYGKTL